MSHTAIAGVLRLEGVSASERLAAFSLASFANREHRAWPGTRLAAARAGLSRSQYLAARDSLVRRDLVVVEEAGGGRGHSPVIALHFAESGPWYEGSVNAELVESALNHSRTRGSARVLLATLAAVADETLTVSGLTTDELCAASGLADSTYRRARATLVLSDELALQAVGGGRANTNQWLIRDPRSVNPEPVAATAKRSTPHRSARALIAATRQLPPASEQLSLSTPAGHTTALDQADAEASTSVEDPPQSRTVSPSKGPRLRGVSHQNPPQNRTVSSSKGPGLSGVSHLNPGQNRTVPGQTPPETPPETPPPNARAGREPQNPRIRKDPPNPPEGGSLAGFVLIVEDYLTDRGRTRRRTVTVSLDEARSQLVCPTPMDRSDWQHIQTELKRTVGGSAFEIWLSALELVANTPSGTLLLGCRPAIRSWVDGRYGPLLSRTAGQLKRDARLATDRELQLLHALDANGADVLIDSMSPDHQEAV
jgi:hypothetical protein